ncbi:MAG: DUF1697 domain-containing protein [Caldithrix sp.]|nr:DUF1697 domain-containing protein [Caldithrix sp.]
MNVFISLLRGINVSGQKKIKMGDLRALYESLSFTNVKTYIQSGNVIFASQEKDRARLSRRIEEKIQETYEYNVQVLIKNRNELQQLIHQNPFLQRYNMDTKHLHVTFLYTSPDSELREQIQGIHYEPDELALVGDTIYIYCPNGYGRTKLSNNFFEKKLKTCATTRNWKTITKLTELAGQI